MMAEVFGAFSSTVIGRPVRPIPIGEALRYVAA